MNDEHHALQQYFADRAPHVDVPSAGAATIARRGRARRHRRTAVRIGAVVGVLAVGGGVVAQGRADDRQAVDTQTAVTSKLAWTVVDAPHGIGGYGSDATATLADGSIYQLSTGPASTYAGPDTYRRVLYRSTDEVTWNPDELPSGLAAGALAADGDRLYALGTAPAGGGVGVRLATRAGGADWTIADVPLDLEGVGQGFPGQVHASGYQLASAGGTTVVAVSVRGELDDASLAAGFDGAGGWGVTPDGIDTYRSCAEDPAAKGAGATTTVADGTEPAADPAVDEPSAGRSCGEDDGDGGSVVARSWTWAELGLDAEQVDLVNGRTYLFTASDGGELEQSGVLSGGSWTPSVLAADGAFWLVRDVPTLEGYGTVSVVRSPDGLDWSARPTEVPGGLISAGVLGGRPALAVSVEAGQDLVVLGAGGPQTVHLDSVVDGEPQAHVSSGVAFGPLGVAFTYTSGMGDDGKGGRTVVVHSADGTTFAQQDLPVPPAGKVERPNNVSVSADAIIVRLNSYPQGAIPGDGGVRPAQRAFVGTPD